MKVACGMWQDNKSSVKFYICGNGKAVEVADSLVLIVFKNLWCLNQVACVLLNLVCAILFCMCSVFERCS